MTGSGLTLLEAVAHGKYVAKTFSRHSVTGEIRTESSFDNILTWEGREVAISGLSDLHEKLVRISQNPRCCILRGGIIDGTDASKMVRRKNPRFDEKTGQVSVPATIEACSRQWAMLDMDGALPEDAGLDFIPADPGQALSILIESLPEPFRNASCVYGWGNSAGIKPKLSAHLFFWLSRPVPDDVLRLWAVRLKKAGSPIDPAVFDPIQVHYVASPRFQGGLEDPLKGRRYGFRSGDADEVDADALGLPGECDHETTEAERIKEQVRSRGLLGTSDGFFGHLRDIGGPLGFHQPIKSAVGAYIKHHGTENTDIGALVELLKERISDAEDGGRAPDEIARYASDSFLRPLIANIKLAHTAPQPMGTGPYRVEHGRICFVKEDREGALAVTPLANFRAAIVGEVRYDDGAGDASLHLEIEGCLDTGKLLPRTVVTASEFPSVARWVLKAWGGRATVAAGMSNADRLREAIQRLSGDFRERVVYRHTGWRKIDGAWCFLHSAGAITANGQRDDIEVELRDRFAMYELPSPASVTEIGPSVRQAIELLRAVTRAGLILPLLAAIVRAVLGEVLGSQDPIYGLGGSGIGKSALFALAQAFFGRGFAPLAAPPLFPGSWSNSENALEREAATAKDVVYTIDDWVVDAHSTKDVLFRKASRVLRDAANNAGRATSNADRTARHVYRSRALVATTAEDVPPGHSLRARSVFLQFERGDVGTSLRDQERNRALREAQNAAAAGLFASVTAAYIRWLAPQIESLKATLPARLDEIRSGSGIVASHARTPTAVAGLLVGVEVFARFCSEAQAFSDEELREFKHDVAQALAEVVSRQEPLLRAADPVDRFGQLFLAVISSGKAHLRDIKTDGRPTDSASYGWQPRAVMVDGTAVWDPQGPHIGWVDTIADHYFVDPESTYAAVMRMSVEQGSPFPITAQRLWGALCERGLILARERPHYTIRRQISGKRSRGVLISGKVGQVGHTQKEPAPPAIRGAATPSETGWPGGSQPATNVGHPAQAADSGGPHPDESGHDDPAHPNPKNPHHQRSEGGWPTWPTRTEGEALETSEEEPSTPRRVLL